MPPPARSPGPACDWTSGGTNGAHRGTRRFPQVGGLISGNPCGGCPICPAPRRSAARGQPSPRETHRGRPPAPPTRRAPAARHLPVSLLPVPAGTARWTRLRPELGRRGHRARLSSTTGRCSSPAGGFFLPRRWRARDASGPWRNGTLAAADDGTGPTSGRPPRREVVGLGGALRRPLDHAGQEPSRCSAGRRLEASCRASPEVTCRASCGASCRASCGASRTARTVTTHALE